MLNSINAIAKKINQRWSRHKYRRALFQPLVLEVLADSRMEKKYSPDKANQLMLQLKALPLQLDMNNSFGEPPVTFYRDDNFVVDVYYWLAPSISVHDHNFSGAFMVLQGRSLHLEYNFERKANFSNNILIGDLALSDSSVMHAGDAKGIKARSDFIHSVWHLSSPTVSLCVRTLSDIVPQFTYYAPHLAVRKYHFTSLTKKKLDYWSMLNHSDPVLAKKFGDNYIRTLPPELALAQFFNARTNYEEKKGLIKKLVTKCSKFRNYQDSILQSFEEDWRPGSIHWENLKEDERFLAALLRTITNREEILKLAKEYLPEADSDRLILKSAENLLRSRNLGLSVGSDTMEIFRMLYRGCRLDEISLSLAKRHNKKNSYELKHQIKQVVDKLQSNMISKLLRKV